MNFLKKIKDIILKRKAIEYGKTKDLLDLQRKAQELEHRLNFLERQKEIMYRPSNK